METTNSTQNLSYHSDTITLNDIIKKRIFFKIPIYQRLYVWGKEQIHALLSDVVSSYKKGDSETKRIFYLGNVIVQQDKDSDKTVYELIDGQQRFTTMWLLSIYLQNKLKDYAFPQDKKKQKGRPPLRIEFDIRDQVSDFMHEIVEHYNDDEHTDDLDLETLVSKNPQRGVDTGTLEPLANAFKEIKTFFLNHVEDDVDPIDFSDYVRNHVKLVKTVVPDSADLNKLFEVLNNRGVQLEHHQILKARMLEILNKGNNTLSYNTGHYAELWDSCSEMKEFLEKGFQDAVGKRLSELDSYDRKTSGYGFYKKADNVLADLKALDTATSKASSKGSENGYSKLYEGGLNLDEALKVDEREEDKDKAKDSEEEYLDERSQEIKSMINFPMLLQHTLRIYLKKCDRPDIDRVLDKELLDTFENHFFSYLKNIDDDAHEAKEAADFIELLWEVRFVFDEFVVKWIKDKGTDILQLCSLYEKKDDKKVYLYRKAEEYKPELSQLQRLLYHSQEMRTFYWLTPFLYFLVTYYDRLSADKKQDLELKYLKYLDNYLLNIDVSDDSTGPLIDRTLAFMNEIENGELTKHMKLDPTVEPLKRSMGLGFPHYWFYKLEFLLWRSMKDNSSEIPEGMGVSAEDIGNFKITAKNSVEHITPQNPRDAKAQSEVAENKELLDCFGNLALVSRSLNSSLSNASYKLKREKFNESNDVRQRIESLKLLHVYTGNKENWLEDDIRDHQEKMINYYDNYIRSCCFEYEVLKEL